MLCVFEQVQAFSEGRNVNPDRRQSNTGALRWTPDRLTGRFDEIV